MSPKDLRNERFEQGFVTGRNAVQDKSYTQAHQQLLDALKAIPEFENDIDLLAEQFDQYGMHIGVLYGMLEQHAKQLLANDTVYQLLDHNCEALGYKNGKQKVLEVLQRLITQYKDDTSTLEYQQFSRAVKLAQKLN